MSRKNTSGDAPRRDAFPTSSPCRAEGEPRVFQRIADTTAEGALLYQDDRNDRPKTIVISHQLAQQYFPGEDPLGKHLHIVARGNADYEIIGVVADTLHQVGLPGRATMYLPILNGRAIREG